MSKNAENTTENALTEYLALVNAEAEDGFGSLGSWLKGKWDESKHKRESSGKFSVSGKTIEKQDALDPSANPKESPEDKKKREVIEEGVAEELGYGSVEDFRADKENYDRFIKTLPDRLRRYDSTSLW